MTHEHEWTDKLSDYLDDDLTPAERRAVDAHLSECGECARTLDGLRRIVERARTVGPRPPEHDLWTGIERRIAAVARADARLGDRIPRRFSFTMPELAAAAVLVAALSGAVAFFASHAGAPEASHAVAVAPQPRPADAAPRPDTDPVATPVNFADAQYDAAVADLERTLRNGRGKLDRSTIAALEQSLQTIDQALDQARQALAADPANTYLSGHLLDTRRRKLDLLRRAAALTETN